MTENIKQETEGLAPLNFITIGEITLQSQTATFNELLSSMDWLLKRKSVKDYLSVVKLNKLKSNFTD